MGQGTKTIFPQLVAEALGVADRRGRDRARRTRRSCPTAGPTVASRTAMVVGGLRDQGRARACATQVEARDRPAVRRRRTATTPGTHGADPHRPALRALPGHRTSTTRPTAATPTRPSAGRRAVAEVDVDLDTGEVHGPRRRRGRRRRPRHPPGPGRGPGRGRHAPGGRLRDDRGDQARATAATSTTGWRRTSSRPRSTRRGSTTILVEAPFAGAPHGAKGVGELPMDVGAPAVVAAIHDATGVWITRPAGDARSGSSPRSPGVPAAAPLPPGASEPAAP